MAQVSFQNVRVKRLYLRVKKIFLRYYKRFRQCAVILVLSALIQSVSASIGSFSFLLFFYYIFQLFFALFQILVSRLHPFRTIKFVVNALRCVNKKFVIRRILLAGINFQKPVQVLFFKLRNFFLNFLLILSLWFIALFYIVKFLLLHISFQNFYYYFYYSEILISSRIQK